MVDWLFHLQLVSKVALAAMTCCDGRTLAVIMAILIRIRTHGGVQLAGRQCLMRMRRVLLGRAHLPRELQRKLVVTRLAVGLVWRRPRAKMRRAMEVRPPTVPRRPRLPEPKMGVQARQEGLLHRKPRQCEVLLPLLLRHTPKLPTL